VATLAGYSLARLRYRGKELIGAAILATYMFPGVLLLIPIFVLMAKAGLVNTYTGLIISSITFSLPFCIWMLRAYFMTLPEDLEDAARIDGCTRLGALWRIVFPLSAPGIAATSVFAFMNAWGNYMFALLLLSTESKKTLPPAIGTFITRETISWHLLMAGGMISTIPVLIFFLPPAVGSLVRLLGDNGLIFLDRFIEAYGIAPPLFLCDNAQPPPPRAFE
jgi:ABC-type glycerol-3-phosphate transport system permease component